MVTWLKASLIALGLSSQLLLVGCKQGENEVCQVTDDCEEGLQCNANTGRCQSQVQNTPDAAPNPIDAMGTVDATPTDATPTDATPTDATPTDGPVPDAPPADANLP